MQAATKMGTILVVEDHPLARKMVQVTLALEGYAVLEAPDGQTALDLAGREMPDLVLLDLRLPDMNGFEVCRRLRDLPGGRTVPILALTGLLSHMEESRLLSAGFTAFGLKPVEPSRLLQLVETYLPRVGKDKERPGSGKRVLAVDDDPVQLKLVTFILGQSGFEVATASDGMDALEKIRRAPPDAIVSDALMPRLDGFQLCLAVRNDRALAHIPMVLLTTHFVEEADQRLATDIGANALLHRSPDMRETITALLAALRDGAPRKPVMRDEPIAAEYHQRILQQLDRQVSANTTLAERSAVHAAALSILGRLAESTAHSGNLETTLEDVLTQCLDASGVSTGALYLMEPEGQLRLRARSGYADAAVPELVAFFGRTDLRDLAIARLNPLAIPSPEIPAKSAQDFLLKAVGKTALIVPLVIAGKCQGVLLMVSNMKDLTAPYWMPFSRVLGAHFAQGITLARTVSELRDRHKELEESQRIAHVGSWTLDTHTGRVTWSEELYRIFSRDPQAPAPSLHDSSQIMTPESFARVTAAIEKTTQTGEPYELDLEIVLPDGRNKWIVARGEAVRDDAGRVSGLHGTALDITARKQLEAQMRQAQKMEAIGQLTGGIAHDFNNMLTIINGYCDLLLQTLPDHDPHHGHTTQIKEAAQRAVAMTRQLLAFSRRQILETKVLDLNAIVTNGEEMLRRMIGEHIHVATVLAAQLGRVKADPGQMDQIIMNLVVNARDAMPQGGTITIETANVELDQAFSQKGAVVPPGPYVMLAVSDIGCGMDAETQKRIFEPFFTTKPLGKGTGLGLATVYGIVKQSNGFIWVYSEAGQGATFKIYLPRVEQEADASPPSRAHTAAIDGTETILLVEDDAPLRKLTQAILQKGGYTVLSGGNGDEAFHACAAHEGPIHLLLTDVVMPGMSGHELAERLKSSHPDMKVLYVSGYTDDTVLRHGIMNRSMAFLQKPFTMNSLLRKVREVLEN